MAFTKSPDHLVERFHQLVPQQDLVFIKKMFSYPCAFADTQLFMGLFEDTMTLRLDPASREEFLKDDRVRPFTPMGRTMREYVQVPMEMAMSDEVLPWIERSLEFARSLPAKKKKK